MAITDYRVIHGRGQSFIWILDGSGWRVHLRPIELRLETEDDEGEGLGVDTVEVRCSDCARLGVQVQSVERLSQTTWSLLLEIVDPAAFKASLNGRSEGSLRIPLLVRSGEQLGATTLTVTLRPR